MLEVMYDSVSKFTLILPTQKWAALRRLGGYTHASILSNLMLFLISPLIVGNIKTLLPLLEILELVKKVFFL